MSYGIPFALTAEFAIFSIIEWPKWSFIGMVSSAVNLIALVSKINVPPVTPMLFFSLRPIGVNDTEGVCVDFFVSIELCGVL